MDAPAAGAYPPAMRLLALDGSLARASAALWADGVVLAHRAVAGARVQPTALPPMAADLLRAAGTLDAVAVVVGPGSFTGLRSAIALAEGIALGRGVPVIGVTTGEALAAALPMELRAARAIWAAVDTRRGRITLERIAPGEWVAGGPPHVITADGLPDPAGPVAAAGDAAALVAAGLLARGFDAMLTDSRLPDAAAVAEVAALRLSGVLPPRDGTPLYQEPPAVRAPA
jgi:tRNA threonylcarbamoyladenosine biosynthesis protein TsaB